MDEVTGDVQLHGMAYAADPPGGAALIIALFEGEDYDEQSACEFFRDCDRPECLLSDSVMAWLTDTVAGEYTVSAAADWADPEAILTPDLLRAKVKHTRVFEEGHWFEYPATGGRVMVKKTAADVSDSNSSIEGELEIEVPSNPVKVGECYDGGGADGPSETVCHCYDSEGNHTTCVVDENTDGSDCCVVDQEGETATHRVAVKTSHCEYLCIAADPALYNEWCGW